MKIQMIFLIFRKLQMRLRANFNMDVAGGGGLACPLTFLKVGT